MLAFYLSFLDSDEDKSFLEHIFYSYRKQMVLLADSILKSRADAEDAVHTVFLRIAIKSMDTVRAIGNETDLRNYLLKATKNTSLNMLKKRQKESVSLDTLSESGRRSRKEALSDDIFLEAVCNRYEYERVVKAISSLDEKYRDVLYYHFVVELPAPKVAELLCQTVPATKKQLVRGKKKLLALLENKEPVTR